MKKTLADFQPLKLAEQELFDCCQSGEIAVIGEERPTEKTEENEIRAEFLRWLILTKEIEIDPKGIQFHGALVSGIFDLDKVHCLYTLSFFGSVFEEQLFLRSATTKAIFLDGSLCHKGILADGLICHGNLHLRNGFEAKAEVRFLCAKIEGDFNCINAGFEVFNEQENALICDGINIQGCVFFKKVCHIKGNVGFVGAKIEGDFDCTEATFESLNEKNDALNCDSIQVGGLLLFRHCMFKNGILSLTNAHTNVLVDDTNFWKQTTFKIVYLDGFTYKHISSNNLIASFRLENMLGKMPKDKFTPQPYKQLAKVLRDMGHDRDADEVMIALHDKKLELSKESKWYKAFRKIYKWTSAYGYRPMRTLKIMASVWFLFGCIYWYGANVAVFAPSNPLIFQKDYNCVIDKNGTKWLAFPKDYNESNNWYIATPPEYTTFQPFWYSLDMILPVIDLKMENDWGIVIPSPEGSWKDMIPFSTTNHFIRFLTWVETLAGWGLSLMLVAILSGLAKNEKE